MKKYLKVFSLIFIIILLTVFSTNFSTTAKRIKINKVLKTEAYTYLPKTVQEIVKDTYLETGNIVLTEKNKKEYEPYINPKYLAYLELNDEQKKNVSEIPELYTIDYVMDKVNDTELPTSYDLRKIDNNSNNNYITPLKNQMTLNLCWAFSTLEQAESLLLVKNHTPYTEGAQIFSPKQLDFACSTNGIKDYTNNYGVDVLNEGGNFLRSTSTLANGVSFFDEEDMEYDLELEQKELYEVLNYNKSLYELNNAIYMPDLSDTATEAEITSYQNTIKEFIMQYGGVYIGSEAPGSCGSSNSDGTYFVRVDDNCVHDSAHAMHVIGWKDDYTYSYCKNGSAHSNNVSNCSQANLVTGTGAWLVRNSWGNSRSYFYITYDSQDLDFGVTTDISSMSERTWDNNYHNPINPLSFSISNQVTNTFNKTINTEEKVEKIKFISFRQGGTYRLSISSNSNNYQNIKEFTVDYPGVYTIDLSDLDVRITDNSFSITINSNNVSIITNSIMVFTKNVDSTPVIDTDTTNLNYDSLTSDKTLRLYTKTKNINSDTVVSYKLYNTSNVDYSNYLTVSNNVVATNNINPTVTIKKEIPNGNYILRINNIKDIPVKIGSTPETLLIKYYANNGTNNTTTQIVDYNTTTNLTNNSFTKTGYTFNKWNTKANGTGTNYNNGQSVTLTNNLDLYAQWTPITYSIKYNANGGTGTMSNQSMTYDVPTNLSNNTFTKEGSTFLKWNTKADGSGTNYYNKEEVSNLTTTANETVNLYAIWSTNSYQIKYYANGGNGTMETQDYNYGTTINLTNNTFTRDGYIFNNWNTKNDGSGTSYTNEQSVTITNNLNLYAQWIPITYNIKFNANGGSGTMSNQNVTYDISTTLKENTFTKTGYIFDKWNTNSDGSGTNYTDKQEIFNLTTIANETINLYAQYKPITYSIKFNSNGGTGTMSNQTITYDISTALNNNTFTKEGYSFVKWNTNSDGSGTNFTNKQEILNLTTTNNQIINLYAIWNANTYQINYYANGGSGTMDTQSYDYGTSINLTNNNFTRDGYIFNKWNTKADGSGTNYSNEQSITVTNNLDLYAQWTPITYSIKFNSNGGSGTMSNQNMTYDISTTLKENTFTKTGYTFDKWNTNADGSGINYTDKQEIINLTTTNNNTINLYAQYKPITYNIEFNANGGTGSMTNQTITYDNTTTLKENTFTKTGYIFDKWTTNNNGTGTSYTDKQEIINLTSTNNETITLYAQYKPITYKIRFLPNGGEGSMSNQDMTYNVSTTLSNNTFTKEGFKFVKWNTSSDGTGTSYSNKQEVINLTTTANQVITLYAIWKDNANIDYEITNYTVDEDKLYIDSINPNTSPTDFINNINTGSNYEVQLELNNKNVIFTGSKTIILHNNEVYKTFTNIIRGDSNGDGKISSLDYVKIKNHIMNTNIINDDALKTGADINKDNKISSLDYVKIKNYIMNGGN